MANRGRSTSRPSRLATRSFGSGFFPGYAKKRPASAGLFLERRSQVRVPRQRAGITIRAQAAGRSAETIGFCFIVLYSDLLYGS